MAKNYINNKQFSDELTIYATEIKNGNDIPIPDYIGECILEIARRLARKSNFAGYSFVEDMVMDAVENCIREIGKFDPTVPTRTGRVNGFGYFTQICIYAFLRRIQKERKQSEIKETIKHDFCADAFAISDTGDYVLESVVHNIRQKQVYEEDSQVAPLKYKPRKKHYKLPSNPEPTILENTLLK